MIFRFDYLALGFQEEEWDAIPRTDKLIIRDYEINGRDSWQASLFGYYETDDSVRKAIKRYDLKSRPRFLLSIA